MDLGKFKQLVEGREERGGAGFVGCEYYFGDAMCSNCGEGEVSHCNLGVQMNPADSYEGCGRRLLTEHGRSVSERLDVVGLLIQL